MAMVVNGWDVAHDNNRYRSVGAQLALTPVGTLSLCLNAIWGPERSDYGSRTLLDAVATFKVGRLTLGANADWARDRNAIAYVKDAIWSGAAGYVRYAATPSFAVSARGESFDDRDGVRTGTSQAVNEFTLTPELRLTPHLLVRGDARIDESNHRVFQKGEAFEKSQPTILLDVLYSF